MRVEQGAAELLQPLETMFIPQTPKRTRFPRVQPQLEMKEMNAPLPDVPASLRSYAADGTFAL
jgi:hypothetical protein